eukprot:5763787-Karenia_brevis.AAC.1
MYWDGGHHCQDQGQKFRSSGRSGLAMQGHKRLFAITAIMMMSMVHLHVSDSKLPSRPPHPSRGYGEPRTLWVVECSIAEDVGSFGSSLMYPWHLGQIQ